MKQFTQVGQHYVHRGKQTFDTGLQLNTLQEYVLIPLDIFKENTHNKTIENELDAWLTFISFDEPEKIVQLIEVYPEFKDLYEELYQFCLNIERVMGMFSKELLELDRNTLLFTGPCTLLHGIRANEVMEPGIWLLAVGDLK